MYGDRDLSQVFCMLALTIFVKMMSETSYASVLNSIRIKYSNTLGMC
jgi:hypothetical protein